MKPKRVDCADCANMENRIMNKKFTCKLGKRIAFRMKSKPDKTDFYAGWPRYCNEFKPIEIENLQELF